MPHQAVPVVPSPKLSADEGQARRRLEDSSRRVSELRESLLSIEKNPTAAKLRGELTQRLTQATRSHEELEKKLAQLGAENDEKRAQLRTILEDLTLEEVGPSAARQ